MQPQHVDNNTMPSAMTTQPFGFYQLFLSLFKVNIYFVLSIPNLQVFLIWPLVRKGEIGAHFFFQIKKFIFDFNTFFGYILVIFLI